MKTTTAGSIAVLRPMLHSFYRCVNEINSVVMRRIIRDLNLIARNYVASWFFIDIVAAVPYDRIGASDAARVSSGICEINEVKPAALFLWF